RRKVRVQPVLPCVVWCCSVRLLGGLALDLVRPVGLCVVLSGGVRLQNVCKAPLDLTCRFPTLPAGLDFRWPLHLPTSFLLSPCSPVAARAWSSRLRPTPPRTAVASPRADAH